MTDSPKPKKIDGRELLIYFYPLLTNSQDVCQYEEHEEQEGVTGAQGAKER
jgi:hypothetical protein